MNIKSWIESRNVDLTEFNERRINTHLNNLNSKTKKGKNKNSV